MMLFHAGRKSQKGHKYFGKCFYLFIPIILGLAIMTGLLGVVTIQAAAIDEIGASSPTEDIYDSMTLTETLLVGTNAEYPPFEYYSGTEIVGRDIDLMNAIGTQLEVSVEYIPVEWDFIFTELIAGHQDAVISGLTITPQREEIIDFTLPYLASSDGQELGIAVRSGNADLRRRMNEALWRLRGDGTLGSIVQGVADDLEVGPDVIFLPDWPLVYSDTETTFVYSDTAGFRTSIHIPANAVNEAVMLVHTQVFTDPAPSGSEVVGNMFDLDGYLDGSYLPGGIEFNNPVTLTLTYSDTDVAGLNEEHLFLNYWNAGIGSWVDAACGNYDRHPTENWLFVPICHLSRFALLSKSGTIHLPLIVRGP